VLASHGPISGADTATLVELRPPAAAWWVHVTLSARAPKATRGWVLMTPELDVRGADACGGPDEGP